MPFIRVIVAIAILSAGSGTQAANGVIAPRQPSAVTTSGSTTETPGPGKSLPRRPHQQKLSFHDLVRNLVAAHEVQPLKSVLDAARRASAGEVVSIKLRRQKGRWVYHVRLLKADGRRAELEIDGKSLKIMERK